MCGALHSIFPATAEKEKQQRQQQCILLLRQVVHTFGTSSSINRHQFMNQKSKRLRIFFFIKRKCGWIEGRQKISRESRFPLQHMNFFLFQNCMGFFLFRKSHKRNGGKNTQILQLRLKSFWRRRRKTY